MYVNFFFYPVLKSSPLLSVTAEPLPLMDLCRRVARLALGRDRVNQIDTLPLPETIKNYLQYQ
jgi:hypothetical protein